MYDIPDGYLVDIFEDKICSMSLSSNVFLHDVFILFFIFMEKLNLGPSVAHNSCQQ